MTMRVSQTGRGNLPQILHATGPCPSAFALSFSANSVACISRNRTPMSTRLSQPRALGWEFLSGLMSGNDYESFPNWSRKFASNFARNRPLPQCIRRVFFSNFCCMHFEKSGRKNNAECTGARAGCVQNLRQISSTSLGNSHSHFLTSGLTKPPIPMP